MTKVNAGFARYLLGRRRRRVEWCNVQGIEIGLPWPGPGAEPQEQRAFRKAVEANKPAGEGWHLQGYFLVGEVIAVDESHA